MGARDGADTDGDDGGARDGDGDGDSDGGEPVVVPERDPLLLDAMLGGLASYLRMCGYDAAYALDRGVEDDEAVRRLAAAEGRRVLTRDRDLAAATPGALLLTERDVVDQLRELREAGVRLRLAEAPARCGACNGPLEAVDPDADRPDYAPETGTLWRCRDCGRRFWKGSHWEDVRETLASL
ncbi:Mut7-C RNAse domain-containing protein [Halobaculum sp. EA56]|uniref:Mut7-C RNAse domain-containing protein n=1 Tax=Halobaculum sp. EA56 TaxID=3421648 RepID=UPI003EBE76E6